MQQSCRQAKCEKVKRKIGLISDTHSYMDERIAHHLGICDEIWHAGDVGDPSVLDRLEQIAPVRGVYGNIDGTDIRKRLPEVEVMEFDGLIVLMIHIAGRIGQVLSPNPFPDREAPPGRAYLWALTHPPRKARRQGECDVHQSRRRR